MPKDNKQKPRLPKRKEFKKKRRDAKRKRREERAREREELGEDAVERMEPRTLENSRITDETAPASDDEEFEHEAENDDLSSYYKEGVTPKIVITTSPHARLKTWKVCFELRKCIPNAEIFSRKNVPIKSIVKQASDRGYTDLIIVHEDRKIPNGLLISHLPDGPSAYFKINSLKYSKEIKGIGESTAHIPEVILNNFTTRLGHTVSRLLGCLFPHNPQFTGRRVVTFHNQRDFIFFRHHRYEFKREGEKAALHELGPRFTLRLKWLQRGAYNTRGGEFEWVYKTRMDSDRKQLFF